MHGITWPYAHAGVWARQCKLLLSKLYLHSQSNRDFSRVYCNPTFYQVLVKQLSRRLWTRAYSSYQVYTPFHFYECPEIMLTEPSSVPPFVNTFRWKHIWKRQWQTCSPSACVLQPGAQFDECIRLCTLGSTLREEIYESLLHDYVSI